MKRVKWYIPLFSRSLCCLKGHKYYRDHVKNRFLANISLPIAEMRFAPIITIQYEILYNFCSSFFIRSAVFGLERNECAAYNHIWPNER